MLYYTTSGSTTAVGSNAISTTTTGSIVEGSIAIKSYNLKTGANLFIATKNIPSSCILNLFINTYLVFLSKNNIVFYHIMNNEENIENNFQDTTFMCIDNQNVLYCTNILTRNSPTSATTTTRINRHKLSLFNPDSQTIDSSSGLTTTSLRGGPTTSRNSTLTYKVILDKKSDLNDINLRTYQINSIHFNPADPDYIYYTNNMGEVKKRLIIGESSMGTGSTTTIATTTRTTTTRESISADIIVCGRERPGYSTNGTYPMSTYLINPVWVTFDYRNNMYIIDQIEEKMSRILKLESFTQCEPNFVYNIAGNGIQGFSGDGQDSSYSQINNANSACQDKYGNTYLADTGNNSVRRISIKTGFISTLFILPKPIDIQFDLTGKIGRSHF